MKITAAIAANVFMNRCISNCETPGHELTIIGKQFILKLFNTVCAELGIETIAISEYHSQFHGQVKQFNRTLIFPVGHYVAENQKG